MDLNTFLQIDQAILDFFNGSSSLFVDGMVMGLTNGLTWIPLYLAIVFLIIRNNETMAQIMLAIGGIVLCVIFADLLADGIAKPLVARFRPSQDPLYKYSIDVVNNYRGGGLYGFFSAHAANTMAIAVFVYWLVRSRLLGRMMIGWSLVSGWTRLYLGVHYPSDVLVGFIVGGVIGLIIYKFYIRLYYRISPQLNYISTQYTSTGYDYSDIDIVMTVFAFTLIYVVFEAILVI